MTQTEFARWNLSILDNRRVRTSDWWSQVGYWLGVLAASSSR